MKIDLAKYEGYIQTAEMLIALGKATVDEVTGFIKSKFGQDDDAVLDAILAEVDARIAARS